MKSIFDEYGKTILYFLIAVSFVGVIYVMVDSLYPTIVSENDTQISAGTNLSIATKDKPKITVIKSTIIKKGITFNPLEYVKVLDSTNLDITQNVISYGSVNTTVKGNYDIRYTVRDQYGLFSDKKITFTVD